MTMSTSMLLQLQEIDCSYNPVTDLSGLRGIQSLKVHELSLTLPRLKLCYVIVTLWNGVVLKWLEA